MYLIYFLSLKGGSIITWTNEEISRTNCYSMKLDYASYAMAQTSNTRDDFCPEKVTIFLNDYHSKYVGYFDTSEWYHEGTNHKLHVLRYETGNS